MTTWRENQRCTPFRRASDDVQIPLEAILGPFGAIAVLLLWVVDLRKQRDDLQARVNRLLDKIEVGPKTEAPR